MDRQRLLNRAKELSYLVLETGKAVKEQSLSAEGAAVLAQAVIAQSSVMSKIIGGRK